LKRFGSAILLVLLSVCILTTAFNIQPIKVNANSSGQPFQAVDTDWWSMFHHDLTRAGNSTSTAPSSSTVLWNYTTGGMVESSPTVFSDVIFVGSDDGKIYALNATTRKSIWNYTTSNSVRSSPAVANGVVYVGSNDHNVYALNATTVATTKRLLWNYTTGDAVESSPAVANGLVYVGSNDSNVYALNATTGAFKWRYTTGGHVYSSPAVANGVVYVGSNDHNVYALNATTEAISTAKRLLWNYTTGDAVESSPAVANGVVYVGSDDDNVYALNATTEAISTAKRLVWPHPYLTGESVHSSPAVAGDLVYVGSNDGSVYALNAAKGGLVWSYPTGSSVASSPAIAGGLVLVGSNNKRLYALNATGNMVWNYLTGGVVHSSPAVARGVVFVGSDDHNVYAFFTLQVSITASPSTVLDVNQPLTFTATVSGESGAPAYSYSYQWYLDDSAVSIATSKTWPFTPPAAGSYHVYVIVTDQFGYARKSNVTVVTVNLPPSVSISPLSIALTFNKTAGVIQTCIFHANVFHGTGTPSYQWYNNSKPVSGATGSSWKYVPYRLATPIPDNVSVSVTDGVGVSNKSKNATVYVNPYSLSISPNNVSMDYGPPSPPENLTATVSLVSASSYTYQWYVDSSLRLKVSVPSRTDNFTYTPSSIGLHTVYVSVLANGNFARSSTVLITVNPPLSVSIVVSSDVTDLLVPVTFTSAVLGGTRPPCSYQWYLNGSKTGPNAANWTWNPNSEAYIGLNIVYLEVTDNATVPVTTRSSNVSVTVHARPRATISPASVVMDVGQSQTFASYVSGGTANFTYQWYLDLGRAGGATSENWTYTPSSAGSHIVSLNSQDRLGQYAMVANQSQITVNPTLFVTISPSSVVMDVGQSQTFASHVSGGTEPFTYQWYLNGNPFPGATNSTWIFKPQSSDSYTVYVKVNDSATVPVRARSPISSVGVNPRLGVAINPATATIYQDQSQTFISDVSFGNSPYYYQWYLNGGAVSGATNSSWKFTPTSSGSYSVYVNVTDCTGFRVESNTATITVAPSPSPATEVTISPTAVAMDNGTRQVFTSIITPDTSSYKYQWYLNGTAVQGANSSSWTFNPNSTGYYQVYLNVTDSLNVESKSNAAFVTVNSPPSIDLNPTSSTIEVGESQVFTSTISGGTANFTYQWYLNGSLVSGATNSWLNFTKPAGFYTIYVNATDSFGKQAISKNANVTVKIPYHDIAITGIASCKTVVGRGFLNPIEVTVSNLGDYTETFQVAVYATASANRTLVAWETVTLYSGGDATTITLPWDTISFGCGNYTISANVTLTQGETNQWIGPLTYTWQVKVTIPGDVNGDGVVNILDVGPISTHWLQRAPQFIAPPSLANADVNGDGVINILDVGPISTHWLQTISP
jgi:outer membrane protein assembly factor BamB